jgi:hypothetical protein
MIYFLPGNLLSLGFEVSWWLFKNTSYVVYQGIKYGITSITTVSNPQGDGIPSEEDLNIEDSIMIIEKSDLIEKLDHIEKMLEERNT